MTQPKMQVGNDEKPDGKRHRTSFDLTMLHGPDSKGRSAIICSNLKCTVNDNRDLARTVLTFHMHTS